MMNNNNNPRHVVKEDAPVMRSVQIQSAPPSLSAPPIMPGRSMIASSKTAPGRQQEKSLLNNAWKVHNLRPVPSFYKLERTHLSIKDASAEEVSHRIAECLRQESVSATFNDDEAMVEAETYDGVTFTTRLFNGDNDSVIVEMQRLNGCCYLFHQTAKTVLRAAKGMASQKQQQRRFSIPPCVPKCTVEEEKECLENGLELAMGMLKKDRIDAHMLAMESLTQLSKSAKCRCLVAKAILTGPLMENIVSLIECWQVCRADVPSEMKGEMEEQHCAAMHRLAIAVLANCLQTLESEGELEGILQERREELCSPSLLTALVSELRQADQRPHDAFEAARCLQPLVRSCPDCKPRLMDCECLSSLKIASETGACSHANLERESSLLRNEIANCN